MSYFPAGYYPTGYFPVGYFPSVAPSTPGTTCIITAQLHDLGGADVAGVTALLIIEQTPQEVDDSYIIAGMATATSDSNGLITFPPVLRGARVLIRINQVGYLKEVVVPDAATLTL